MKLSKLTIACALAGALFATSASATVYQIAIIALDPVANPGKIIGDITVSGTDVTAFTGTASGFGAPFDGAITLGQGADGPTFKGDNKWLGAPVYVGASNDANDATDIGGGWLLTDGLYNFKVYDYVANGNDQGDRLAWFGSSGGYSITISETPLPAAWTMMLIGVAGLSAVRYRGKAKTALA